MERKSELCPYYDLYHFEDGKLTDYNYLIIAEEVHINTVSDWFKLYQSVVDYFSKKKGETLPIEVDYKNIEDFVASDGDFKITLEKIPLLYLPT